MVRSILEQAGLRGPRPKLPCFTLSMSNPAMLPTPPEVLAAEGRFQGGLWLLAEVELSRIDTRPVRLSVSLPANLVQRIKAWEIEHQMIQSSLLALAAQAVMRRCWALGLREIDSDSHDNPWRSS